jgi:hypothetical protein
VADLLQESWSWPTRHRGPRRPARLHDGAEVGLRAARSAAATAGPVPAGGRRDEQVAGPERPGPAALLGSGRGLRGDDRAGGQDPTPGAPLLFDDHSTDFSATTDDSNAVTSVGW